MVASALALSLIGLGAVQALPSGKQVEERQIWIGDGTGVFTPGDGTLPVCLTDVPLQGQPPCILPPIVGGLNPGKNKRQVLIGGGSTFTPGQGDFPVCLADVPLNEQPPCILPPIVGGLNPGKNKRQVLIGGGSTFTPGQGAFPVCLTDVPLNEQPPCILPPIVGGLVPPTLPPKEKRGFVLPPDYATNTKEVIKALELQLESLQNKRNKTKQDLDDIKALKAALKYLAGITKITAPPGTGSTFTPGKRSFILPPDYATNTKEVIEVLEIQLEGLQNKPHKTEEDLDDIKAIKAALKYLVGITKITAPPGTGSTFTPGKRGFVLPPDYATNTKEVIKTLELELEHLQNKHYKTEEDLDDIKAIKAALKYLVGITNISAPPGTGSTFTPGKRGFVLPPDYATNTKEVIKALELQLEGLQNKPHKTKEDLDDIKAIKAALKYLVGITKITAPPGTGSTFTPGKRDVAFNPDTVGTYASVCPNLAGAEIALEALLHKDRPSLEERIIIQKLTAFLKGCGVTIVKSPDGTWTTIKPSDKRDVEFDTAGLKGAYFALLDAATKIAPAQPSFANWLAIQQIGGLLKIYGVTTTFTVDSVSHPKRAENSLTVGSKTCQLGDILGLRAALAALLSAYGSPTQAPINIFLIEQVLVSALQLCGQGVPGWTTLVPGATIPGGPVVPDPTVPGGPIVPDPTVPGGEIHPSDRKRQTLGEPIVGPIVADPTVPGGALKPSTRRRQTLGQPITGPIIPDPTIPGGALKPSTRRRRQTLGQPITGPIVADPTVPGGALRPSDRRRQAPVSDPAAMLQALKTLEEAYGSYGSGKIPAPVFLIMVNIVTILQGIPGVVVPGWPVLGAGSVVLTPST